MDNDPKVVGIHDPTVLSDRIHSVQVALATVPKLGLKKQEIKKEFFQ